MGPSGLSSMAMNPARAAGMIPLYAGQRLPQHGYPVPPQAQPLPRQGPDSSGEAWLRRIRLLKLESDLEPTGGLRTLWRPVKRLP